jgi:hypothetical protein
MQSDRPAIYRPRKPRASPLWQRVNRHLPELRASGRVRRAVEENVLGRFLECGDLHCGFARIRCGGWRACRRADEPLLTHKHYPRPRNPPDPFAPRGTSAKEVPILNSDVTLRYVDLCASGEACERALEERIYPAVHRLSPLLADGVRLAVRTPG